MTIRAVKEAVLERLRGDVLLEPVVFEGSVDDRPDFYVSVHTDSGRRTAERFTGPQVTSTQTFTVHSVGSTPDQAHLVAERVMRQMLDHTLLVPGRTCRRIQHGASEPAEKDREVSPALWYVVDEFSVTSNPVPT